LLGLLGLLAVVSVQAGCSGNGGTPDGAPDARGDAVTDQATIDGPPDGGDATGDASPDAAPDIGIDFLPGPEGLVTNQRIVYTDGLHNENTEMIRLDDRILLVFRGGETGQVGSERAHLNIYASMDDGATFVKQSEINAGTLP